MKNWKKTKKVNEIKITEMILIKRSLNELLYILKIFKNSIGMNKINIAIQKRTKNQNKP